MVRKTFGRQLFCEAAVLLSLLSCFLSTTHAQQAGDLVSCKPVSKKTSETGCWILTSHPLGIPDGLVYWTIDLFPTSVLAEQAKGKTWNGGRLAGQDMAAHYRR